MSVIDIPTRVDSICKKYDKYDVDKHKESNISGDDAFARQYAVVEAEGSRQLKKSSGSVVHGQDGLNKH